MCLSRYNWTIIIRFRDDIYVWNYTVLLSSGSIASYSPKNKKKIKSPKLSRFMMTIIYLRNTGRLTNVFSALPQRPGRWDNAEKTLVNVVIWRDRESARVDFIRSQVILCLSSWSLQSVSPDPGCFLFDLLGRWLKCWTQFFSDLFFIFPHHPCKFGRILLCIIEAKPFGM